jgi:DNA-3-methyladenine glycosylase II
MSRALSSETLSQAIEYLAHADRDLARLVSEAGPPPLWAREPGFPTLVHIILEQQVSLASARAAFIRLQEAAIHLTPARFLEFTDGELKGIGFSRQKTLYCRELAGAILGGKLDLLGLKKMDDLSARTELMKMKGIGSWTADIYLLLAMLRPDIWPAGDLALATAVQDAKGLPLRPGPDEMDSIARPWRPWRAVAARILWHHYLCQHRGSRKTSFGENQ